MSDARKWVGLAGWTALPVVGGFLGGQAGDPSYYGELTRPSWAPPGWLFGPVWTVLYIAMGVAAWLVWREGGFGRARTALGLFLVQLVPNVLWTPLFFGMRRPDLALVDLVVLWLLIVATIAAFRRWSTTAALLLVPYLLWVTFAGALNFALWRLNP